MYPKIGFRRDHDHPFGLRMDIVAQIVCVKQPNRTQLLSEPQSTWVIFTRWSLRELSPTRSAGAYDREKQLAPWMCKTIYVLALRHLHCVLQMNRWNGGLDCRWRGRGGLEVSGSCHKSRTRIRTEKMARVTGFDSHTSSLLRPNQWVPFIHWHPLLDCCNLPLRRLCVHPCLTCPRSLIILCVSYGHGINKRLCDVGALCPNSRQVRSRSAPEV